MQTKIACQWIMFNYNSMSVESSKTKLIWTGDKVPVNTPWLIFSGWNLKSAHDFRVACVSWFTNNDKIHDCLISLSKVNK